MLRFVQRWKVYAVASLLAVHSILVPSRVLAADAWAIAAQALGIYAAYQSTLSSLLAYGADPIEQVRSRYADVRENGRDTNGNDTALVDGIMHRLISTGDFVLSANSLPFAWQVNDSSIFNASCYPTDYISVNRGLVRVLHLNEDEIAAVLAHEMTHGIRQHAAKDYAKAVAAYYGMTFLNMQTGVMDWNKLNGLSGYAIAKNVTLPSEYEADAGGFQLMTDAGFNPGGPAAAMARMAYYMTYETRDTNEYEDPDKIGEDNFSDHPETGLREKRLAKMMTDYGADHVTLESGKTICIDSVPLLTVDWTSYDYDDTAENAYLVAGGLAKAFHDYDSALGWNFRPETKDFLTTDPVYGPLKTFVARAGRFEKLQSLVAAAYEKERTSGAREALRHREEARQTDLSAARGAAQPKEDTAVKKLTESADAFVDAGAPEQAMKQIARVFALENLTDKQRAAALSVRGRAKAALGTYREGLAEAEEAVRLDGASVNNLLNLADARRMAGDTAGAAKAAEQAVSLDGKNPTSLLLTAEIYDQMNDQAAALDWYRKYEKLSPEGFRVIPEDYLKEISEKDWKILQREREEQQKARAEAKKSAEKKFS